MQTILTTADDFAMICAGKIASLLRELQGNMERDVNVVFATGRTMVEVLGYLSKSPTIEWPRIQAFHLDEFVGMKPSHDSSIAAWLDRHLFSHVAIPREHIHYMGTASSPAEYMKTLKRVGGADLVLLGLGLDGHLAFNKSGSAFTSRARRVRLSQDVIDTKALEFPPIRQNPYANTLGLKDLLEGRHLMLLVNGASKAEIVAKVYFNPCSPAVPATVLRRHPQVTAILDSAAAANLNAVDVSMVTPFQIRDQLAHYSQTYSGIRYAGMGLSETISIVDRLVAFFYGFAYGRLLYKKFPRRRIFHILLGRDSRPTGRALAVCQAAGIRKALLGQSKVVLISDMGIVTTPLLESAVRYTDAQGAVMITASHNPIPQNGWKYMSAGTEKRGALLDAGSLLDADEKRVVIRTVQSLVRKMCAGSIKLANFVVTATSNGDWPNDPPFIDNPTLYKEALNSYTTEISDGAGRLDKELVVVSDYNGGAAARVNVAVLRSMGFKNVISLGTELGVCDHAIEPVGAAMDAASDALVRHDAKVGVVYDFDADRGNLVWLKPNGTAADVSPQNVAAMNVAIELLKHKEYDRRKYPKGLAVVGHCATSGATRTIASNLNAAYFRVETGEVNVVKKMAELTRRGYLVAVGVEGYSGGTVFPGSKCRDGLRTLLAVTHLLSSQKMIDSWRRSFGAEHIPRQRRKVFVSELLDALPRFVSLQDKITAIELSPYEFRVQMEKTLKKLISRTLGGLTVKGVHKIYRSILIEYSGETKYYSKPVSRPAGFGLRGRFTDGGWIVRFIDHADRESFIWVRGSKTEVGIYKRLVDSSDPKEAVELKSVLEQLCAVGTRRAGKNSGKSGNMLLVLPKCKAISGWPVRELPSRSLIILLHDVVDEFPSSAECVLAALQNEKLGNTIEWLNPNEFSASVLAERRPTWLFSKPDERIEEIVATFNRDNAGPKTQILLCESGLFARSKANSFFSFPKEVLQQTINAIKEHKTQVRRTRYDLSVDKLCRSTLLSLRAAGAGVPASHIGAYQFVATRWSGDGESVPVELLKWDKLSGKDEVFFISPHPDDMEIAAGGLVATLSAAGIPVQNIVLTLGGNGVIPTAAEKRSLQQRFGDWTLHLGELRRAEAQKAAAVLQKSGSAPVDCQIISAGYDEGELRRSSEAKIVEIFKEDATKTRAGKLIFFLPHPEDEHPRHRFAYQLFSELLKKHSKVRRREVDVFLYLSPWAGRANAYFVAPQTGAYFKLPGEKAAPAKLQRTAARLRKQGLSYLVHELIGGFGSARTRDGNGERIAAESFFLP